MELLSIHINKKENSYFVFLINILSILNKKVVTYNNTLYFYTNAILKKRFTIRLRLKSLEYLKTLKNTSWIIKLLINFIVVSIDSVYIVTKFDTCETIEEAEDRLGLTFNGKEFI